MALFQKMEWLIDYAESRKDYLATNATLLDIYEGDLLRYIEMDLKDQLQGMSLEMARHRIAPINVLQRIVNKLSKIYSKSPSRAVGEGSDQDAGLLKFYEQATSWNKKWAHGNRFYNIFKCCLMQPYITADARPGIRAVQNDRFLVWSDDEIDPTRPTGVLLIDGHSMDGDDMVTNYVAWTADEMLIFNSKQKVDTARMVAMNNPEGRNPYGALPFVYVNRSENLLMPKLDSDTLKMTKLIPVLMSDLNFAAMFQCFSIIYGINLDESGLTMSPNAFWRFKSDPKRPELKPEVGVIKPQVDIQQMLGLIQSELGFWLNTRGIRPGAVGELTADNFASALSKMVDEMDTFEEREAQVDVFQAAEVQAWDLQLKKIHPIWAKGTKLAQKHQFTQTATVQLKFPEQVPMRRRGEVVSDLRAEEEAGYTTRRRALKVLNPMMSDTEIEDLEKEIADAGVVVTQDVEPAKDDEDDLKPVDGANATTPDLTAEDVLNGAQIDSLLDMMERVAMGTLPKASAAAIMETAFNMKPERVQKILAPIVEGSVKPLEEPKKSDEGGAA